MHTSFARQSVCFEPRLKVRTPSASLAFQNRKLRDRAILILHFHRQIVSFEDRRGEIENAGQLARRKAMLHIIRHPGLERARGELPNCPAAIDESLVHATRLRDMGVRWNNIAIRKDEPKFVNSG